MAAWDSYQPISLLFVIILIRHRHSENHSLALGFDGLVYPVKNIFCYFLPARLTDYPMGMILKFFIC
jgi:hypothetical protein